MTSKLEASCRSRDRLARGGGRGDTDKVIEADDEVEAAEGSGADETFLEEEEEGDDDVSTLIDGDIEDDEEA